ncbi:MAG: SHOCT domain-containing protein [Actinomycetota bacterium]|nr:SHOCT domain-containing protein [Actinomycetota bacterium]
MVASVYAAAHSWVTLPATYPNERSLAVLAEINFGQILWTTIVVFFMIAYLMILFRVIFDIFRNRDMSGGMKAVWLIAMLFLPVLVLFIYVIVHGTGMAERDMAQQQAAEADFKQYVSKAAADAGPAAEIAKAKELLDAGSISQQEFEALKAKALA